MLRLVPYVGDRSLWIDEAQLALNLIEKPWSALFSPLAFNQGAPIGFLLTEKLAVTVVGPGEQALRLFPLICGIAAIPLFVRAARSFVSPEAVPVAVALFVSSESLIYYASEVKQYSTDVAATLVLLLLADRLESAPLTRRRAAAIGVAIATTVWFSHAALFVAAGVSLAVVASSLERRDWTSLRHAAIPIGVGLVSAAGALAFALRALTHLQASFHGQGGGNPFPPVVGSLQPPDVYPTSVDWFRFPASDVIEMLGYSSTRPWSWVLYLVALTGVVGLVRVAARSRFTIRLLLLPLLAAFAASLAHEYPLRGRTILFVLPIVSLLIAEGAAAAARALPARQTWALVVVATLICGVPAARAAKRLIDPPEREDVKPALRYLVAHWKPSDTLYLQYAAQYAFAYYADCRCLDVASARSPDRLWQLQRVSGVAQFAPALRSDPPQLIVGEPTGRTLGGYVRQLTPLRGRARVWILVSHVSSVEERAFVRRLFGYLDCVGRRFDAVGPEDAALYGYDLRRWSDPRLAAACDDRFGVSQ